MSGSQTSPDPDRKRMSEDVSDASEAALTQPASSATAKQRRLEDQRDLFQAEWHLRMKKLEALRKALAIETGVPTRFQLQQQLQAEDVELAQLTDRLEQIEQALSREPAFPTVQPASEPQAPLQVASVRVFISYRSQEPDIGLAQQFYESLQAAGHHVFLAGESIRLGENWSQRVDEALEQCDFFLLLLSPQSAVSEMVTEEVRRAKQWRDLREDNRPSLLPIRVNFPFSSPLNYDLRGYLQQIQQREWTSSADTPAILQEVLSLVSGNQESNDWVRDGANDDRPPALYGDHLRRHLWNLEQRPEMAAAVKRVVPTADPVRLESVQAFQLHSMGLVNLQDNDVAFRCELYRRYFGDRLNVGKRGSRA